MKKYKFINFLDNIINKEFERLGIENGRLEDKCSLSVIDIMEIKHEAIKVEGLDFSYWIKENGNYKCDNCGNIEVNSYNYCPNCGCKMQIKRERDYING